MPVPLDTDLIPARDREAALRAAYSDQLPRLTLHLEAHLADPDLTIERVAAAHHVSVRHLYDVWAEAGHAATPAQWLLRRRLARARHELVDPALAGLGVAAVARRCGFRDASHFGRRFRQEFGLTPREWRASGPAGTDGPR